MVPQNLLKWGPPLAVAAMELRPTTHNICILAKQQGGNMATGGSGGHLPRQFGVLESFSMLDSQGGEQGLWTKGPPAMLL